jgi:hypothetical protein
MHHPNHITVLSSMINLRRLPMFQAGADIPKAFRDAWAANDDAAELRILEIAELAYLLEADGFPEQDIFRRIGFVHPPAPDLGRLCRFGNSLRGYVVENLGVHAPSYLKIGAGHLNSALVLAELWAMLAVERRRDARWPPSDMLAPSGPLVYLSREPDENDANGDPLAGADAIEVLDVLAVRYSFPAGPDFRRMRARAVPGDELRNYSTGAESFQFMMGSAGIALVRSGRAIDYAETLLS